MVKISTLSLSGFDPLNFFAKLGSSEKNPAYFTSGQWTVITWDPTTTIQSKNVSVFQALLQEQKRRSVPYRGSLPFLGGAIGFLDYDVSEKGGMFHVYDHALLWNGKKTVMLGDQKFIQEVQAIHKRQISPFCLPRLAWKASMAKSAYASAFKKIQNDIRNGEYYQLNLTYRLDADFTGDRRRLFCALAKRNPASCASYFEHDNTAILSLSPERFLTIDRGRIVTCPIKGTRPRGNNPKEDVRMKHELLGSEKEAAELNMITDLLRNDIGLVSSTGSVRVTGRRLLQKNPSVWHTVSVIEGELRSELHPVEALRSMFPGGSVTGCPKRRAMQAIAQYETTKRGPYCGSMVMLSDHGRLDSTILIRTIVAAKKRLTLGIGGGIVADSQMAQEWQETIQKAKPFTGP